MGLGRREKWRFWIPFIVFIFIEELFYLLPFNLGLFKMNFHFLQCSAGLCLAKHVVQDKCVYTSVLWIRWVDGDGNEAKIVDTLNSIRIRYWLPILEPRNTH